jgi:poly(hydroxyalkanoate) depolymerase family esterase
MASLGETVAALLRRKRRPKPDAAADGRPPTGLSEIKAFGENPGNLKMYVHRPADLAPGAPLVVVLHGCAQNAGFAGATGWIELADRLGFAVVAPQQRVGNNPNRCFNWFLANDIRRGAGEAASIRQMVQAGLAVASGDPKRVYVTGLSAGGAMAAAMLAAYPDAFAGGAILSGIAYRGAEGLAEGFRAMRHGVRERGADEWAALVRGASPHKGPWPRVSIWQGAADAVVNPHNARAIARQWVAVHGLQEGPTQADTGRGRRRLAWGPASAPTVELHLIDGFGHGAPISGSGPDGVGHAGPFVMEAGISSTREIARFWGLDAGDRRRRR